MVREHSPLPDQQAGGMKSELVVLFGRDVVEQSERLGMSAFEWNTKRVVQVQDAADRLLSHKGHPERQREAASELPEETKLMLCVWMLNPGKLTYGKHVIR